MIICKHSSELWLFSHYKDRKPSITLEATYKFMNETENISNKFKAKVWGDVFTRMFT